ncbi:MAG TPA: dienelactone hydrolase family protein [Tepidiformaceae bacterium]|nr:dienelactone hydrolase family protein [Tepidiformaceae bacterium]
MANMWDETESQAPAEDLDLRILRVAAAQGDQEGSLRLRLETTRGLIEGLLHPIEGGTGAVVCVGGAMGGLDGPADRLYARLPGLLAAAGVTVLRIEYRQPNNFEECVLDTLAACSFLKGIGASGVVLVGHSFGAAVVIRAGELNPFVRAVAALSTQLFGTQDVAQLGKPLLLVHGTADSILSHEASEDVYRRAADPRQIVLYAETGHGLAQARSEIDTLLTAWIPDRLAGVPMSSSRSEVVTTSDETGSSP